MNYEELLERAMKRIKRNEGRERFEVPVPEVFFQGNQTVIRNFGQIASVLNRDPRHFLKYMAKELAAPGHTDGRRASFQRVVSKSLVQKKVENYVSEFVVCRECKKPDTKLVREGRVFVLKCEACGARMSVKQV